MQTKCKVRLVRDSNGKQVFEFCLKGETCQFHGFAIPNVWHIAGKMYQLFNFDGEYIILAQTL